MHDFAECLEKEEGLKAFAPYSGTIFNLLTGEFEKVTEGIPVPKKTAASLVSTARDVLTHRCLKQPAVFRVWLRRPKECPIRILRSLRRNWRLCARNGQQK